jgi:hypothetical protein
MRTRARACHGLLLLASFLQQIALSRIILSATARCSAGRAESGRSHASAAGGEVPRQRAAVLVLAGRVSPTKHVQRAHSRGLLNLSPPSPQSYWRPA